MGTVFISYSRKDKSFASRLCNALTKHSRDVWIDWEDIPSTAKWWAEISAAIEASEAFIFLISPDSIASTVCNNELNQAITLHKRLLPLLIRDTPAPDMAPELSELNWIFLRESDDFDKSVSTLLEALDTDLNWVRNHSRLLVRAGDWVRHTYDKSYLLRGADLDVAQEWLSGIASGKRPEPAPLHYEYLQASQQAQTREVEHLQRLYRNALARQLAAQCTLLQRESDALLDRSIMLAVESLRRVPNAEADRCLREGLRLRAQEFFRWQHEGPGRMLTDSPEGKFIGCCSAVNEVTVLTCDPLQIYKKVQFAEEVTALAFMTKNTILVATADTVIFSLDIHSGAKTLIGYSSGQVNEMIPIDGGTALMAVSEGGVICYELRHAHATERWRLVQYKAASVVVANSNNTLVAVGFSDCTVRVLEINTGRLLHQFSHKNSRPMPVLERGANDKGIVAVSFANNDNYLCSAGLDGEMRVWDLNSGTSLYSCKHERDLLCMKVHNNRGLVASGGLDRVVRLWDLGNGREVASLVHQGAITALVWSNDGRWLLSACGDGTARLWMVDDNESITEIARCIHDDWVENIVLPVDGIPVSVSSKGEVISWSYGQLDWFGRNHDQSIKEAVSSDDGHYLLAFTDSNNQILYDTENNFSWRILTHPDSVDEAWITRDKAVITTCWDGVVREYDLETLEVRCAQNHSGRVWKAALSPDQRMIATAVQGEHCIRIWNRGENQANAILSHSEQIRSLAFSLNGELLATACEDGVVQVWKLSNAQILWSNAHQGIAWSIVFDHAGERVASAGEDGHVIVYVAHSGKVQHTLINNSSVAEIAFSPNGRYLAVRLSHDGAPEVPIWDLKEEKIIARIAHEKHIHDMDWSSDSTLLSTASQDQSVRVFNVDERVEIIRLKYADLCTTARFIPDTQQLLSTSYDGSLRVSLVDSNKLIERALIRVPRQLSNAEWRRFLPDEPR